MASMAAVIWKIITGARTGHCVVPSLDIAGVRTVMTLLLWAFGLLFGEPIAGGVGQDKHVMLGVYYTSSHLGCMLVLWILAGARPMIKHSDLTALRMLENPR